MLLLLLCALAIENTGLCCKLRFCLVFAKAPGTRAGGDRGVGGCGESTAQVEDLGNGRSASHRWGILSEKNTKYVACLMACFEKQFLLGFFLEWFLWRFFLLCSSVARGFVVT